MEKLQQETKDAIAKLLERWADAKIYQIKERKLGELDLWWDNPNLVWVLVTDREEDYEGSQAQIGIAKDGSVRWEYQSHCSCDGYEDSKEVGAEFLPELTKKSYELSEIPEDWESLFVKNIELILKNV